MSPPACLGRTHFDAATLLREHPPRFKLEHKRRVYDRAMQGAAPTGTITYSRWAEASLPAALPPTAPSLTVRADTFDYEPDTAARVAWYLNFAHTVLFVAYGGPLLAQDELQVLEHPSLGSIREALVGTSEAGLRPVTREGGRATPVLIAGVERRCVLATEPDFDAGRPLGLYGNRFARARPEAVMEAVRVLAPPTRSNVIAMEAPQGGTGAYSRAEIETVLGTAFTGFAAARAETARMAPGAATVIHTGHWGTGAYGGDRELMATLQLVAARLAGVEAVVFHSVTDDGVAPVRAAETRAAGLVGETAAAVDALAAAGFVGGDERRELSSRRGPAGLPLQSIAGSPAGCAEAAPGRARRRRRFERDVVREASRAEGDTTIQVRYPLASK